MKVVILSRAPRSYSTRRLREAARERGHDVRVMDTLQFAISVESENPNLLYRGRRISPPDVVIPRIGSSVTTFGTAVVRQFQQMGVFVGNTANSINNSRDKLRALQILSRHDIGLASTMFVRTQADILPAIRRVGGAPIIIKLMQGTQGMGVILAESEKVAEAIVEAMHGARQNVLIQKFVAESKGRDIRAFVVGDRVVAAMRRTARGQEFRSNIHRGATAEAVTLEPAYERAAVRAAGILGLRIAGVDMLESATGPQIIEVNSSPGLEGIERTTEIDVAGAIIDYLSDQVAFPELDIRERLTLSKGFGVVELNIGPSSLLHDKTIAECDFAAQEIIPLHIERNGITTPQPPVETRLLAGDQLLCFGRLTNLKTLLPGKPKRRRRAKS